MKKKFLLALLVLVVGFMGLVAYADEENYNDNENGVTDYEEAAEPEDITEYFTDERLRDAILVVINYDQEYPVTAIYSVHVVDRPGLDLRDNYIESLDGIEHFAALTWLNISGNNLESLYLPGNIKLTHIDASNNNLTEIDLRANIYLKYVDLSGNEDLDVIDLMANIYLQRVDLRGTSVTDPRLPENMGPYEDEELLFYVYVEEEPEELEPVDGILIDRAQVKGELFDAINWEEIDQGDGSDQNVYLRVTLATGADRVWFARNAIPIDTDDLEADLQEPNLIVRIFSWTLILSAILSFILSMILFIIRKE